MINLSNALSFLRAPLALLFLQENIPLRLMAIALAMFTDSIDGYVARRNKCVTRFGAILDPTMDKFFVVFLLTVLFLQGSILGWQILAMLSRDFFLFLFGLYLTVTKKWQSLMIKPVNCGKITTAMQFLVLIGLTLGFSFTWHVYVSFIVLGAMGFLELYHRRVKKLA